MSSYPGENPQSPENHDPDDQQPPATPAEELPPEPGTEPTQPVGYWERRAAEQAREQRQQGDPDPSASQGAVFNPTSAQPSPGWDQGGTRPYPQEPYGPPPGYGQAPYGQAPYGQPPYAQTGYGPPASGQPSYGYPPPGGQSGPQTGPQPGPPPGYPPYAGFAPPRPDHPQSNLALILGIVGLVFGFTCGVGFLASPFAWALGRNAVKDVQASRGQLGGEGSARAGMIMGIIGTVVLVLGVLLLILFAVIVAVDGTTTTSNV
jgi:hypothetical protein